MFKKKSLKFIICFGVATVLFLIYLFSAPRSVEHFYTLRVGGDTPYKIQTEAKDFDGPIHFAGAKFYVYFIQKDIGWCQVGNCGMSGALVECLGGWMSSEVATGYSDGLGLTKDEVVAGKSVVIIAGKNQKIIGIYPDYTIKNIPYILSKNHRDLSDKFDFCYNTHIPSRWR